MSGGGGRPYTEYFCYKSVSHSRLIPGKCVKLCHCPFYSFFPSFLPSFFPPTCFLCLRLCLHTHCRCRGLLWHLITFQDTDTLSRDLTRDGPSQRPLPDKTQRASFFSSYIFIAPPSYHSTPYNTRH